MRFYRLGSGLALAVAIVGFSVGCGGILPQIAGSDEDGDKDDDEATFVDPTEVASEFKANSTEDQTLAASAGSAIEGAELLMPAGALAIDTSISVSEGADIADSLASSELGLEEGQSLSTAGPAVVIAPDQLVDATQPFTISLPVTSSLGLTALECNLVVVFRVRKASEDGKGFVGVIPTSEIALENKIAKFETKNFGSFQAACAALEITERKEVASLVPIQSKHNSSEIAGHWKGECRDRDDDHSDNNHSSDSGGDQGGSTSDNKYEVDSILLSDTTFSYRTEEFTASDCSGSPVVVQQFGGTYKVGAEIGGGAKELDVKFDLRTVTFHTSDIIEYLNQNTRCGFSDWEIHEPKSINDDGCLNPDSEQNHDDGPGVGDTYYLAYKLDGDKLQFADDEGGDGQEPDAPERRETNFDHADDFMTKVQ